jgi:hypothetical protein
MLLNNGQNQGCAIWCYYGWDQDIWDHFLETWDHGMGGTKMDGTKTDRTKTDRTKTDRTTDIWDHMTDGTI